MAWWNRIVFWTGENIKKKGAVKARLWPWHPALNHTWVLQAVRASFHLGAHTMVSQSSDRSRTSIQHHESPCTAKLAIINKIYCSDNYHGITVTTIMLVVLNPDLCTLFKLIKPISVIKQNELKTVQCMRLELVSVLCCRLFTKDMLM